MREKFKLLRRVEKDYLLQVSCLSSEIKLETSGEYYHLFILFEYLALKK